jgi:excinuclease UvrABC nuclease subunit
MVVVLPQLNRNPTMPQAMPEIPDIFHHRIDFDPAGDFEAFLKQAPAKWVVYLFAAEDGSALQLLCVKNFRYSLRHRLSGERMLGQSKRVDYREIVRRVYWRRVDSRLEADLIYHDLAQRLYPESYRGMLNFRPAWFLAVNPEAKFPRYTKTIDLSLKTGILIGPVEDKHAAARLIERVEDSFDLCRYYNILVEAPNGRACAYKGMGKCPAPCDGSISMEQYRRMIEWSAQTLADPSEMIQDQTRRMEQAAADLRFETAAKIKSFIEGLSEFGTGAFRHAKPLSEFAFLSLQPGPGAGAVKLFLIVRGVVEEIASLIAEPRHPSELLRIIFSTAEEREDQALDQAGIERIGIVSYQLFSPKKSQGIFLRLSEIADATGRELIRAYRAVGRQKPVEEEEGEGVINELQGV